jgi:hypothetical protein
MGRPLWPEGHIRTARSRPRHGHSRLGPPGPPPHIHPKPGGGTQLLRLLLVKPKRTFDEEPDGPCGHDEALPADVIVQDVEASLEAAEEGLGCRRPSLPLRVKVSPPGHAPGWSEAGGRADENRCEVRF